jgi:hypothetical protein
MSAYTIYDAATGEIRRIYEGPSPDAQVAAGEAYLAGRWSDVEYRVDVGQPRPVATAKEQPSTTIDTQMVPADGVTALTVGAIPVGTLARVVGPGVNTKALVQDGSLALTFDTPGGYRLRLTHSLYLPREYAINAT